MIIGISTRSDALIAGIGTTTVGAGGSITGGNQGAGSAVGDGVGLGATGVGVGDGDAETVGVGAGFLTAITRSVWGPGLPAASTSECAGRSHCRSA